MNGRCETDPLDRAVNVCDSCFGEFCDHCLTKPKGRRHPVCTECALAASGVRRQGPPRKLGSRRSANKRRQALAEQVDPEKPVFEYFDTDAPLRVPVERPTSGKKRRRKAKPVVAAEPIDAEPDADLVEIESHQEAGGMALNIERASVLTEGADDDAAPADERATPAVAKLTELRNQQPDDEVVVGGDGPPPSSADSAPVEVEAPPGESVPPTTGHAPHPEHAAAAAPGQSTIDHIAATPTDAHAPTPAPADHVAAAPTDAPAPAPGQTTADHVAAARAGAPAPAPGQTTADHVAAARAGAPAPAPAPGGGQGESGAVGDTGAERTRSDQGPGAPTTGPSAAGPATSAAGQAAAERGRRKTDKSADGARRPTTAPMIGEVRTIGGRRSADAPEPEVPPSAVRAGVASSATHGEAAANAIEEFDAGRTDPASNADEQADAKADTDLDGNWIPPILRGMAPDAREAKAGLPKRQRSE